MLWSRLGFMICKLVYAKRTGSKCPFLYFHKALNFKHIGGKNDGRRNWKVGSCCSAAYVHVIDDGFKIQATRRENNQK